MRYYSIVITDPAAAAGAPPYWKATSQDAQGNFAPSALNVELDLPVSTFATPAGGGHVRVWGIPLSDISQSRSFKDKQIQIYGGMQKGLPLANPAQAGLLAQGVIVQPFGNWVGPNMTLEFIIQADGGTIAMPKNIVHVWRKGTPLAEAIKNTMATAFPGYTAAIAINSNLVLPHDEPGYYQTLTQFAQYVRQVSQTIIGGDYQGVDIVLREKAFSIYDETTITTPKVISFYDLIGQPTWINPGQVQVKCVMRGDLSVGDYVTLPAGPVIDTPQAYSAYRNTTTFQGTYQIDLQRHIGNFRQASADSWVTVIDAHPTPVGSKS